MTDPKSKPDPRDPVLVCPSCGRKGKASDLFGHRTVEGVRRWQEWCRFCRAKPPKPKPEGGAN